MTDYQVHLLIMTLHLQMKEVMYEEKVKKFGKTYGRYNGVRPTLVTIEPDLVKSILVKNFDSFHGVIDLPVW